MSKEKAIELLQNKKIEAVERGDSYRGEIHLTLVEAGQLLSTLRQPDEKQSEGIAFMKRVCEDFRWLYDQRALGPLDAAAQYGPDYEPPTDEQCLEIRGKIEIAIAKAEEMMK